MNKKVKKILNSAFYLLHSRQRRAGFTLVELLVVMAIISILATVSLGYFRGSQIKGRDARRKHDLNQIQKALEMYYNDKGVYRTVDEGISFGNQWTDPATGTLYMKQVPNDPSTYSYVYESDTSGTWYKLYARLENEHDLSIRDYGNIDCGGAKCNFRVTSPNAP